MNNSDFKIRFDKNTIDHLGIKLYSTFPPVIVELISNAYDADAENVIIEIDYDRKVVVIDDDGLGMTFKELNDNYLVIGRNRRLLEGTGLSPVKKRKITGKKGLGKLAVFGIAKTVEVYSIKNGFLNSFRMNYDDLKAGNSDEYYPNTIDKNTVTENANGTRICIKEINSNIMDINSLSASLSKRFTFYDDNFKVVLKKKNSDQLVKITKSIYFDNLDKEFSWSFPENFTDKIEESQELKRLCDNGVKGQIYTKATPLKKSQAGFLLYVRNKLASENTFFNERSNDNFNSYVTGYFDIDYIDESNKEDHISTARQSILWETSSETRQLREDLDKLVSLVSRMWRECRKEKKETQLALEDSFFEGLTPVERTSIIKVKDILLKNSDETSEINAIKRVLENMVMLYKFESFQSYIQSLEEEELTLEKVEKITNDWEYIESKELAKVATGRIEAIKKFEEYININASETKYIQPFLEKFPWILDPRITTFEREKTYSSILKEKFPDFNLNESNRRIDFLCNLVNNELIIIELKRPNIKISNEEIIQAINYKTFVEKHYSLDKVKTFLISDRYDMEPAVMELAKSLNTTGTLYIKSYSDLLRDAKKFNEEFIIKYEEVQLAYKKD